ncbi:MAG: YraN family protein [Candidatus Magasanikbacteria bacterium]|nr:YraN family protein [Candidatus Magasanikbacteria bacterium]
MEGKQKTRTLGAYGESLAAEFLLRHGFQILTRNFRVRGAELDIIARKENALYFVEVKTRSGNSYGAPESAIHYYKQRHMQFAAQIFLAKNAQYADGEMHFSSLAVEVDVHTRRARMRFFRDIG